MQVQFEAFVENPTAVCYRRVLAALRQETRLPEQLQQLELHFQAGEFAEVSRLAEELMPAWGLSARVHYLASAAALELQDLEDAEIERHLWRCCITGMLATGDGSEKAPYLVCCPGDAEELLNALELKPKSQKLVERSNRLFDRLRCRDGSEVWFDVTVLFETVATAGQRISRSLLN